MSAKHPSPAKIVVVEDNSADVFLLRHALDQHLEEYVLEVLRDGEEAIDFVNRQRLALPHGSLVSSCSTCIFPSTMGRLF